MSELLAGVDLKDAVYLVIGAALFGMTLKPALARFPYFNLPLLYIAIGALVAPALFAGLDPTKGGFATLVTEHVSELIVIISLAGAGLSIDTREGWRSWQPTWRLLAICMPLTILSVVALGSWLAGLPLAAAVLLGGCLAPTDPVLASSVQTGTPDEGEEHPVQVALTAESGLNDGMAFPFVWLAIAVAESGAGGLDLADMGRWLAWDVLYRTVVGIGVGFGVGAAISRFVFSAYGDARFEARNPLLIILAATFLAYGAAEAVEGYGFLAAFTCTRAGRANTRGTENASYERHVHKEAGQFESVLLAIMLLWFGSLLTVGAMEGWRWSEAVLAALLVFVVRPITGFVALSGLGWRTGDRWRAAFFGIRGMGSIFYIAFAQEHAGFDRIEAVWRIAVLTILLSVVIHGFSADSFFGRKQVVKAT